MKDLIVLVLYVVVFACLLGTFGSLVNYFFGWSVSFKGATAPADLRATGLFVVLGGACALIIYLADKRRGSGQNNPD